jgi:hypothetical protein
VRFVYFEAFDQPWKTHLPIEPHWGLFRSDRSPKALAATLLQAARPTDPAPEESVFFVFQDADSPRNHFEPSGFMGDIGDVQLDETFQPDPHSGITSIKVTYSAKGTGPNTCNYSPPCRWAGVYWQEPQGNWGKNSALADRGFDLSRYSRLAFWAKAERSTEIEFKVGGISEQYGDSLKFPRAIKAKVETAWQEFHIDLEGADLKQIIGGFVWVTSWETNPGGITFYLDDIRFVR